MKWSNTYLVGLAGGSASGKTTFIQKLSEYFTEEQVCVISQDHYYKGLSQQVRDSQGKINFDHPLGIDYKRIKKDIRKLIKGEKVKIVEYTFNNPSVFPKEIVYKPAPIILLEGIFAFADKSLNKMYDYKLFIEADENLTLKRRLERDMRDRGATEQDVLYQWKNHVKPAYNQYLKPHKLAADFIINNNDNFEAHMNTLVQRFRGILDQAKPQ